jgi:hypothetical protein
MRRTLITTDAQPIRSDSVVSREIAGERVLVPIRREAADLESIFVLNEVASFVWDRLDGQHSLQEIQQALLDSFDVSPDEAEADIQEFLAQLSESGLLHVE